MAWPTPQFPPASGAFRSTHYDRVIPLWLALRERNAIINNNATEWPIGQDPWSTPGQSGVISTLTTSGVNLRLTDAGTDPDFNPDWIDEFSIKRWTSFAGTWHGVDITPAPSAYKVVIYPADSGSPSATQLCDASLGGVYDIEDNGDNWLEFFNDGTLLLNGKSPGNFAGYKFQIIRQGGSTRDGVGWIDRFPWRPNDKEIFAGAVSSSGTTFIIDARTGGDAQWRAPVDFSAIGAVGKDVVFKCSDSVWRRRTILTAVASVPNGPKNKITFATLPGGVTPIVSDPGYWILTPGKFWLPRGRVELTRRTSRGGKYWQRSGFTRPWQAGAAWNNTYAQGLISHSAEFDDLTACPIPLDTVEVDPGPPAVNVTVFDFDGRTSDSDAALPENQTGHLFSPRLYWSNRGLQVGIETIKGAGAWVEPRDYDHAGAIPDWTTAGWFKYFIPANTRTVTITATSARDGGVATIATTLPSKTAAEPYTSLPCTFTIYDADGAVKYDSQGTVTATTITDVGVRGFIDHLPVGSGGDGDSDLGLTCVVAFCSDSGASGNRDNGSWTRRYARTVKYLYPRTYWQPDDSDHPGMSEDFPGTYVTNAASTSYAEYTKYGVQEESGGALKNGELVYYLADSFEDPTTSSTDGGDATLRVIDVAFQGLPNDDTVSNFPRWEDSDRAGTCTAGGSFYLEDNSQTWWCSASPSHTHSGTGGAGSNASTLIDTTKSTNGYWQQANRFVGMILEVELDPVGAAGVYARSPITAYNSATQTVSVSPAFSSTTFGKSYRIREPGADPVSGGIILNLWAQRRLKVTRRSDSSVHYCNITYSDDTRVYFTSGALGYTPLAGDAYEIIQIDPGLVVKYDPSSSDPLKTQSGWTGPYAKGTKPTICTAYGKYRKRDYVGLHFWDEAYKGIDALRWIKAGFTWSSRADAAVAELNERIETDGQTATGLDTWDHAKTATEARWTNTGTFPSNEDDGAAPFAYTTGGPGESGFHAGASRAYAYGVDSGNITVLNSRCDFFAHAIKATTPASAVFDANGDTVQENKWRRFFASSITNTASRRTATALGNTALPIPDWCDAPSGAFDDDEWKGYLVDGATVIRRYDVSHGLTYVTPPTV
jgi:hypothetical protein